MWIDTNGDCLSEQGHEFPFISPRGFMNMDYGPNIAGGQPFLWKIDSQNDAFMSEANFKISETDSAGNPG